MARSGRDPGSTLGPHLVNLFTEGMVKAREALTPMENAEKWKHTTAWLEDLETEMAPFMGQVLGRALENPELPDDARALLEQMTQPNHQFGGILQLMGLLGAVFTVIPALGQAVMLKTVQAEWQNFPYQVLTPAEAAEGVMRGIVDQGTGEDYASRSGVGGSVFNDLVQLTGEPPGPMDMLSLWRRGFIGSGDVESALLFSRIKDVYIPWVLELAYQPMSAADAIETAIKGVVDVGTAQENFEIAGGMAEQFETLYEAAGNSIGTEQVLSLWNQGLAGEADVDATLGRSRLNPIFYPLAKLLRHKFLAPYQITQVLKAGGATPQQANEWMTNLGYGADQAAAIVASGTGGGAATSKAETEGFILTAYTDQVMSEAETLQSLVELGYTADVAAIMLANADMKRELSQRTGAVSAIKASYIARKITSAQATSLLGEINIPAAAINAWLTDWDVEQSAKINTFTLAQIGGFAKKGIIDYPTAVTMWQAMGWTLDEANILAADYDGPNVPGSPADIAAQAAAAASGTSA